MIIWIYKAYNLIDINSHLYIINLSIPWIHVAYYVATEGYIFSFWWTNKVWFLPLFFFFLIGVSRQRTEGLISVPFQNLDAGCLGSKIGFCSVTVPQQREISNWLKLKLGMFTEITQPQDTNNCLCFLRRICLVTWQLSKMVQVLGGRQGARCSLSFWKPWGLLVH